MPGWTTDRETVLEAALILLAIGLLVGLGVLIFGRLSGGARRGQRRAESPPAPGSVPSERHQNLGAPTAR